METDTESGNGREKWKISIQRQMQMSISEVKFQIVECDTRKYQEFIAE